MEQQPTDDGCENVVDLVVGLEPASKVLEELFDIRGREDVLAVGGVGEERCGQCGQGKKRSHQFGRSKDAPVGYY